MAGLDLSPHPNLLVGMETADDAGVYLVDGQTALVQTVDFFTPVVDDPFDFGRIAAANALSDVYAMGGRPLTAMNIVCFPSCDLERDVLIQTLRGGLEKLHEAGCVLVGGHSVDDPEFKYGLAVTGLVRPDEVLTNAGANEGDVVVLTKPVGTGVLATAIKGGLAADEDVAALVDCAAALNAAAAEAARAFSPSACTDVTGFGLAGHLLEMAKAAGKEMALSLSAVPLLPKAVEYARMGLLPAGAFANKKFCRPNMDARGELDPLLLDLAFDPQTSGGLLLCVAETRASGLLDALSAAGVSAAAVAKVLAPHPSGLLTIVP